MRVRGSIGLDPGPGRSCSGGSAACGLSSSESASARRKRWTDLPFVQSLEQSRGLPLVHRIHDLAEGQRVHQMELVLCVGDSFPLGVNLRQLQMVIDAFRIQLCRLFYIVDRFGPRRLVEDPRAQKTLGEESAE